MFATLQGLAVTTVISQALQFHAVSWGIGVCLAVLFLVSVSTSSIFNTCVCVLCVPLQKQSRCWIRREMPKMRYFAHTFIIIIIIFIPTQVDILLFLFLRDFDADCALFLCAPLSAQDLPARYQDCRVQHHGMRRVLLSHAGGLGE